jgi:hypothetical protein
MKPQKTQALLDFVRATVEWYEPADCIIGYQLENEALLRGFGHGIDINIGRLRAEYALVSELTDKPVYMSTSNGWGIPLRRPRPRGGVGFSIYTTMFNRGKYTGTIQRPWLHRARRFIIEKVLGKPVFIHELQLEPWGPEAIWKMNEAEQDKSMSPERIRFNIDFAQRVRAYPIDMWGGEWWYWRMQQGDASIWHMVKSALDD